MSLSRIYRGESLGSVLPHAFAEFGYDAPLAAESPEEMPVEMFQPAPAAGVAREQQMALDEAYAAGRRAGVEEAESHFHTALAAFAASLAEIGRLRDTLLRSSTDDMVRLVMVVAEKVIASELQTDEEKIVLMIQNALQQAISADEFRIKVNPEDLALVREKKPLFLASVRGLKHIIIEADPGIARGGSRLESALGEVDATIEGQLAQIRQELLLAAQGA